MYTYTQVVGSPSSSDPSASRTSSFRAVIQRTFRIGRSPGKLLKGPRRNCSKAEDCALIQYVALYKDQQHSEAEWPSMKTEQGQIHKYWVEAAKYIQATAGVPHIRSGE